MLYTPNNILYKYIRYRFRRIQIECNMVYDVTPEEEDEICRNLLKKESEDIDSSWHSICINICPYFRLAIRHK